MIPKLNLVSSPPKKVCHPNIQKGKAGPSHPLANFCSRVGMSLTSLLLTSAWLLRISFLASQIHREIEITVLTASAAILIQLLSLKVIYFKNSLHNAKEHAPALAAPSVETGGDK